MNIDDVMPVILNLVHMDFCCFYLFAYFFLLNNLIFFLMYVIGKGERELTYTLVTQGDIDFFLLFSLIIKMFPVYIRYKM